MRVTVTLLGTGTPRIDPERSASALLVEVAGDKLLFDAGRGAIERLVQAGHAPQEIDAIFITHYHADHIGSLGDLLMTAWHNGRTTPIELYGPPGTARIISALLDHVYARDIAFTMFHEPDTVDLRSLVHVYDIQPGLVCTGTGWRVTAEYVSHGHTLGLTQAEWPCLGYRLEADGKVLAISGDTVACAGLDRLAAEADLLVQCCYLAEAEIQGPGDVQLAQHIIASSSMAGEIAERNRVRRLVLTHIRTNTPPLLAGMVGDVQRVFAGEILLGHDLMVIDV